MPEMPHSCALTEVHADTSAERRALLRESYEHGTALAIASIGVMVSALLWLLWSTSPQTPLLVWAAFKLGNGVALLLSRRRRYPFERWYRNETVLQFLEGLGWGLLPLIAMPQDEVHQALLLAVLAGITIASALIEPQFARLALAFCLPMVVTVLFAYLVFPGALGFAGSIFGLAAGFALLSGSDQRMLHCQLADKTIENNELLGRLEVENAVAAELNAKLDGMAWTDALTGLANRAAANRRLDELMTRGSSEEVTVTVAFLDLNGFKLINDTLGHDIGDHLLIHIGERLQRVSGSRR